MQVYYSWHFNYVFCFRENHAAHRSCDAEKTTLCAPTPSSAYLCCGDVTLKMIVLMIRMKSDVIGQDRNAFKLNATFAPMDNAWKQMRGSLFAPLV